MTLKEIFGRNLKYYRYQKNLTQEKLAELANLDPRYIQQVEKGIYGPNFNTIEELCRVLNVEPYLLFQETSNTHRKLARRVIDQQVTI